MPQKIVRVFHQPIYIQDKPYPLTYVAVEGNCEEIKEIEVLNGQQPEFKAYFTDGRELRILNAIAVEYAEKQNSPTDLCKAFEQEPNF